MMNIQLLTMFFFCYATVLACAVVAHTCRVALDAPILAVLLTSPAPIVRESACQSPLIFSMASLRAEFLFRFRQFSNEILTACKTSLLNATRIINTLLRTVTTPVGVRNLYRKFIAAMRTDFNNTLLKVWFFTSHFWTRNAFTSFTNVLAKTLLITEVFISDLVATFLKSYTAIVTGRLNNSDALRVFPEIPASIDCGGALSGTENPWPTFVIPKFLAAFRAVCSSSSRVTLAFTRTIFLWCRWVIGKDCSALRTGRRFHISLKKVLALCGSVSLSRCTGIEQACDTNKNTNQTVTPRHSYCTTLGGHYGRT